ncbi:hypothetical protein ACIQU2_27405 [Pseudomonas sp. NPDC098740]|uniref:hypothetical protein n=1 Tax=Pseudomonas sp. NPDC098740 TaxID=3364486 RepID=UPI00383AAC47
MTPLDGPHIDPLVLLSQHLFDPILFAPDLKALASARDEVLAELRRLVGAGELDINRARQLRALAVLNATARLRHMPLTSTGA